MPDIQAMYEEFNQNNEDVVILGVANPKTDEVPYNQDGTIEEVTQFLSDNGYTYPVVMDTTGEIFAYYGVTAFPNTFIDVYKRQHSQSCWVQSASIRFSARSRS